MVSVAFLEYTYDSDYKRYATISRLFNPELKEISDEAAAAMCGQLLKEFLIKNGLPTDLKSLNLSDEDIDKAVEYVFSVTVRISTASLKPMNKEVIKKILNSIR